MFAVIFVVKQRNSVGFVKHLHWVCVWYQREKMQSAHRCSITIVSMATASWKMLSPWWSEQYLTSSLRKVGMKVDVDVAIFNIFGFNINITQQAGLHMVGPQGLWSFSTFISPAVEHCTTFEPECAENNCIHLADKRMNGGVWCYNSTSDWWFQSSDDIICLFYSYH